MPAGDTGGGPAPQTDRVVLVTGAASGIGRATALRFARDGLRVACVDVAEDALAATVATIEADGGTALCLPGDVGLEETAQRSVAAVVRAWGALDVLANVAGIGHFCPSDEETTAAWDRIVGVNLTGTFFMCREALPHLVERRGAIVNVASIAALRGNAFGAAYSASKGGVVALTRTLACEYAARGVRVNAVCPGGVLTPIMGSFVLPDDVDPQLRARIIPLTGQLLEPDEIANAIAFLSSDDMRSTTGSVLVVDGGTVA